MSESYDIAVSFTEARRAAAGEVAEACRQRGLTVLEGNDFPDAQVRFLVAFVSTVEDLDASPHVFPVPIGEIPESLVDTLVNRVEAAETAGEERVPVAGLVPAAAPVPATNALRELAEQFAIASPALTKRGLSGTLHLGDSTIAVRVERSGDTVYALEVRGDESVNFVVLGGSAELFPTLCGRIEDMLR